MVEKALSKLAAAKSKWQHVRGLAQAMVASAQRLHWAVIDAFTIHTDQDRVLELDKDPQRL